MGDAEEGAAGKPDEDEAALPAEGGFLHRAGRGVVAERGADADALGPEGDGDDARRQGGRGAQGATGIRAFERAIPGARAGEHIGRAQELRDEARGGAVIDLTRRGHLDEAAAIHHGDAVGQGEGLGLVMRDHDEGGTALALDGPQLEARALPQVRIERAEGFVQQQEAGALHQGAGQGHALALAAGEGMGAAGFHPFEPQHGDGLLHAGRDLGARPALALQPIGDVGRDGHVREQRVGLEHHVHRAAVGRNAQQVRAVQRHRAGIGCLEAGDHAQQRGLAGARAAEQGEELAGGHVERDAVERRHAAEAAGDAAQGEACRGHRPCDIARQRPALKRDQERPRARSAAGPGAATVKLRAMASAGG
ncbi:hypothetical protein SAMN02745194_02886 [Roseomonas rosea]|uniref:Uncharacterized protein n=1 Tax=Muricoccus roseus TaxID=198092 RepID=A0A1M6KG04_9PROT|nr:hypothetical protein SAMN02745194_02886 [Roseomonas rosea]